MSAGGAGTVGVSAVDVAIVAYRGWELTDSCLRHLRAQSVAHRVTVCDNGCDQGTAARLAEEYPEVQVVRMPRNMPYPIACNAAVAAGKGELVVMMNNDVDAPPEFLERLLAPFCGRPHLGSVGALLLRPGERQIDSAGLVADRTLAGFPRFHGLQPAAARERAQELLLSCPAGAAAAFRRPAWEEVGGLDESIVAYLEDFDLGLRLRAAGWETALAHDAVAVHVGSATLGHRSAEQRRKIGHARAYLLRRYGVLRSRTALRTLLTEALVIAGDALLARDLQALAGRIDGWHAAAGLARRAFPPHEAIDMRIGLRDSLALRRGVYLGTPHAGQGRAGLRGRARFRARFESRAR